MMRLFRLRTAKWKAVSLAAVATNLLAVVYMWTHLDPRCRCHPEEREVLQIRSGGSAGPFGRPSHSSTNVSQQQVPQDISELVTVVFREFEFFEHDLVDTVRSFLGTFPQTNILLVVDKPIYPQVRFPPEISGSIKTVLLNVDLDAPFNLTRPESHIKSEYVLLLPDSMRVTSATEVILLKMLDHVHLHPTSVVAVRVVGGDRPQCLSLEVSLKEWTLVYKDRAGDQVCGALCGSHALLMNTEQFTSLTEPFARPFPQALFLQTAIRHIEVHVLQDVLFDQGKVLFQDHHNKWKHETHQKERLASLYEKYGIKKVVQPGNEVEWHGCSKDTPRCFGTVVDDMPDYLFSGKWTPPCCLDNLRQTARHVFKILKKCGTRYWLEGGSLLGAARNGDIIPWDYDVDIGIYKEDIPKCEWLKNAEHQSIIDTSNFLWEKAREGDFFRVQFSKTNHLHVDIFPFYSKKGIMSKDTWFITHKQDMEFPEHFLKPLTEILFVGMFVSAPNNIREFLELKFGRGAIENPEYPVPEVLPYGKAARKS